MQKFMQLELFRLLAEIPQNEAYTSQLEGAYDEFALQVLTRLQLGNQPCGTLLQFRIRSFETCRNM